MVILQVTWQLVACAIYCLAMVLVHEAGHVALARFLGIPAWIRYRANKGRILCHTELSRPESVPGDLLITAAGVIFQLLLAGSLLAWNHSPFIRALIASYLPVAGVNLLVVEGSDGYHLLQALRKWQNRTIQFVGRLIPLLGVLIVAALYVVSLAFLARAVVAFLQEHIWQQLGWLLGSVSILGSFTWRLLCIGREASIQRKGAENLTPYYIVAQRRGRLFAANKYFSNFWQVEDELDRIFPNLTLMTTPPASVETLLEPCEPGFFRSRAVCSANDVEAVILGVPYCAGSLTGSQKTADFPNALRRYSFNYPVYSRLDQRASGLFFFGCEQPLFAGMTLRDMGNLLPTCLVSLQALEKAFREIFRWSLRNGTSVISIGGDHSLTYAAVKALSEQCGRRVLLVQFDAHHDCGSEPFALEQLDHSNFVHHLLRSDVVCGVVQVGLRGLRSPSQMVWDERVKQISAWDASPSILRRTIRELIKSSKAPFGYISLDLDCLTSGEINVEFPLPDGLRLREVIGDLLHVFSMPLYIAGVDIVEGIPDASTTLPTALTLLAFSLEGIHRQRTRFRAGALHKYLHSREGGEYVRKSNLQCRKNHDGT